MSDAVSTIPVPAGELQSLLRQVESAMHPQITWNESAQRMHESADLHRRRALEALRDEIQHLLRIPPSTKT